MNIRGKIILIVLPLIITPLLFAGLIATLLARNGITGVATQFLQFKAEQVSNYANGQWSLLLDNDLADQPQFRDAAVDAVGSFARGLVRTESELIFAVTADEEFAFVAGIGIDDEATGELSPTGLGSVPLAGWGRVSPGGTSRVAYAVAFDPFGWTIYVTERESTFYASTVAIVRQVGIVLAVSVVVSLFLLIMFAGYLTRPLRTIVDAMTNIIETNDLSQRVDVLYKDETGRLAHTFNLMTGQLERAYEHIKSYALRAATARLKEQKTRTMFQKYVPSDVIEQFFANPERMLVGQNRDVSILFSDIRDFTTISEQMPPEQLVETLNQYFTVMVDTIMSHHGIIDKYIGDAIMALFGTPEQRPDDARQSLYAALDMVDALKDFNVWQEKRGLPPFRIGVGVNYGEVTVGNIGTEKKLDYTVIGDMVNVASRLEGLTKRYHTSIVVSQSVLARMPSDLDEGKIQARLLDTVQVKGRIQGVEIFAVARSLSEAESECWKLHNDGMKRYYARDFVGAREQFAAARKLVRSDENALMMIARCDEYSQTDVGANWNGIVGLTEK